MARVLAIANQKGGVGKTTTVINVAAFLADQGQRVLAVDLDPQGNTTTGLGVDKASGEATLYEVLMDGLPIGQAVVATEVVGLHVVPATIELAGATVELAAREGRERRLREALAPVIARYDYILIDCPPSLGLLTVNALVAADAVWIPVQCEFFALEGLGQLLQTIELVRRRLNPQLQVEGAILTMYDARTNLAAQVAAEVRRFLGERVFPVPVPRTVRLSEAPSHGLPISRYDPRSRAAEVYRLIAQEVVRRGTA
ncbi:MAG: AAA family ATPase [Firmicutes bacterium]|nr:ParA family protein [Alicyclobacillaceae bacterium]MCL6496127.1 AAA family ATPase [Bacillota bacterium]